MKFFVSGLISSPKVGMNFTLYVYVGVVHVGGDMFASVPKGDAIFLKVVNIHILCKLTLLLNYRSV